MKLVIHAGAHKTATTSLQAWLWRSRRALQSSNTLYLPPAKINETGLIKELHSAPKQQHSLVADRFMQLLTASAEKSESEQILISHESILSFANLLPGAIKNGFYGALENSAAILRRLGEEYDLSVVFFVRRQDTFLASVYVQYMTRGTIFSGFEQYLESIDYRVLSWLELIHRLRHIMCSAKIAVRPFEIIERGGEEFLRTFLEAAEVTPSEVLMTEPFPQRNEGLSSKALNLIQACGPHLGPKERRTMSRVFHKQFPPAEYGKARLVSPELAQEICAHFSKENKVLFDTLMPEYLDFKY